MKVEQLTTKRGIIPTKALLAGVAISERIS